MTKKILIVDDEPEMLEMIRFRLEKSGYTVFTATTGEECIKKAQDERPDVILLDILLPDLSGYEVSKRIKANEHTKNIPIIMVTAFIGDDAKKKGLEQGAQYFISKPFNPEELLSEIKNIVEKV